MRKLNRLVIGTVLSGCVVSWPAMAEKVFDPLLDAQCERVACEAGEEWNSTYLWYPGQLAAHKQAAQKRKSDYRCVNVDYPGTFVQPAGYTLFRKEAELPSATRVEWYTTGEAVVSVNGSRLSAGVNAYMLPAGKCRLEIAVTTTGALPALIVKGAGMEEATGWQASLDGNEWNLVETDRRYNRPHASPDEEQERSVVIRPDRYIPIRNAEQRDGALHLGENGGLLVDFRHIEIGDVVVRASGTGRIAFRVGESPEEAMADGAVFEQRIIRSYPLTPEGQDILLPERALRYVYVTCDRPCVISSMHFAAKVWPVEFQMQFDCDDPALNDLWNAGVATLHTTLHNFYLDGVKRDYLPWSMDAVLSGLGGNYAFGDRQVARNGLSIALLPPAPQEEDLGVVDYPLHALIGFKQDYLRYGDLTTSLMYKDRIVQQMAFYESRQDADGFIWGAPLTWGFIPSWHKMNGPDDYGAPAYAQMLLYENFNIAAYFARLWNEDELAAHYEQKAKQLERSIIDRFWNKKHRVFVNGCRADGTVDNRISHHSQFWGVLTGLYPEKDYDYLFDVLLPSLPYYRTCISYEKGYEFMAWFKAGRCREVFDVLRAVWGDWLGQGYTRFPENFLPHASLKEQLAFYGRPFGLSLCHSANGVVPILAVLQGIYGFSVSDETLSEYTLRPNLLDLNRVDGRIPVKEGYIGFHWERTGTCSVTVPDGCVVRLYPAAKSKPLVWDAAGTYTFEMK